MSKNAEGQSVDDKAPLPEDVLKGLVGGRRGEEAKPMDGDHAAALTAGAEAAGHGGGFVDVAKAGFNPILPPGAGNVAPIKVEPLEGPGHGNGAKPAEGGVSTPAEPAKVGAPGEDPTSAALKDFQNLHGTGLKTQDDTSKTYWKGTVEKEMLDGNPAKVTTKSTASDNAKTASEKQEAAADEHRTHLLSVAEQANKDAASKQAGQQSLKSAETGAKTAFDTVVKSHQDVQKKPDDVVKGAQNLVNIAQDIHKTSVDTVKATEENLRNAVKTGKSDDVKAAKDAYIQALSDERTHKANLDTYKQNLLGVVGEKIQDKVKDLKNADDALKKARGDAGDEGRPRANSLPAGPTSPAGDGSHAGRDGAATTGDAPKGQDVGKQVEKTLHDADAAKKAADVAKKADEKAKEDAKKAEDNRKNLVKFGDKVISQVLTDIAKTDAKATGNYKDTTGTEVTHGGAESKTEHLADGSEVTTNTLHQTTLTQGHESWKSDFGEGENVVWSPKAEAGYETVHTTTDDSGHKVTVKDKAQASVEWQNKAGYSITKNHVDAEASTKLVAHAELSHSSTETVLGLENTTTTTVSAHGEAGAKAGFHLGYDGVNAEVKVSAEATVSATVNNDTKIGDATATVGATVFAQAKAGANASAEVNFDPKTGAVKAKVGGGFEATAGVGADVNVGLMSDSGNGVGGTAHFKAGSVGVKFEPDLSVKDGKVDFKLSVGGYLGVGGTYDFQIKGDVNKAAENVNKASDFIEKTENPIVKTALKITQVNIYIVSAISGFFS